MSDSHGEALSKEQNWTAEENANFDPPYALRYNPFPGGIENPEGGRTHYLTVPMLRPTEFLGKPFDTLKVIARALNAGPLFSQALGCAEEVLSEIVAGDIDELSPCRLEEALKQIRHALLVYRGTLEPKPLRDCTLEFKPASVPPKIKRGSIVPVLVLVRHKGTEQVELASYTNAFPVYDPDESNSLIKSVMGFRFPTENGSSNAGFQPPHGEIIGWTYMPTVTQAHASLASHGGEV